MADKIKVVMIDDEEDLCLMVKDNLEDTGEFEVATCSNPAQAVDFVAAQAPALILLDVVMPNVKGPEILEALKKNEDTKRIPIIMVSGKGEMVYNKKKHDFKWVPNSQIVQERGELPDLKGAEALAEAYGAQDYVSKPFATEMLVEVIKDVLQRCTKQPETNPEDQI